MTGLSSGDLRPAARLSARTADRAPVPKGDHIRLVQPGATQTFLPDRPVDGVEVTLVGGCGLDAERLQFVGADSHSHRARVSETNVAVDDGRSQDCSSPTRMDLTFAAPLPFWL